MHPYARRHGQLTDYPLDPFVLQSLRDFHAENKLKVVVLRMFMDQGTHACIRMHVHMHAKQQKKSNERKNKRSKTNNHKQTNEWYEQLKRPNKQ